MKKYSFICTGIIVLFAICIQSCKVDTYKEIRDIAPQVSLVQTGTGSVQLKPEDLLIDKKELVIKKVLGVSYAGFKANETFTAKVHLNLNDLPPGYVPFEAGECYIAGSSSKGGELSVEVPAGTSHQPFYFTFTKAAIDAHIGQKLAVKVEVTEVNKYTLNENASTVYLLIDMNDFGTVKEEVTGQYIKNAVFDRAAGTTSRFANLADWLANDAVTKSRPTGAGYDANAGKMGIERWGSYDSPIINGKIYQYLNLPKGMYQFALTMGTVIPDRDTYFVVTDKSELPDDKTINTALASKAITSDFNNALLLMDLKLEADTKVAAGFLLNFDQGVQKVLQTANIKLYALHSLFD